MKTFRISKDEIVESNWPIKDQLVLCLLKYKGAPIEGSLWFRPKEGHIWERYEDVSNGCLIFNVKKQDV